MKRWMQYGAACALALMVAACGGGATDGSAGGQASPAGSSSAGGSGTAGSSGSTGSGAGGGGAAAPAATLAITGFAPTTGAAGTTVTVNGTGLTPVTGVTLAGVAAAFTRVSDTQLTFVVPAGAASGRIGVSASGAAALAATDFAVPSPAVQTVTPASVLPGGQVTFTGTALDQVSAVRLGSLALPILSKAPTTLVLQVPAGAASGYPLLTGGDGVARPIAQWLAVAPALSVTALSPLALVTGQTLTVTGTGLDRAAAIGFTGAAPVTAFTRIGSTQISVTVPDGAASGTVTINGSAGEMAVSAATLAVTPAVRVDAAAVYAAAVGSSVTLAGSGLAQVTAVTVGGTAAVIGARSATALAFTVPPATTCGAIVLTAPLQAAVAAGTVVVGGACSASIAAIEFAQNLSQPATDPRQRLVPGKETWVRATVTAPAAGRAAPAMRVTAWAGTTLLGSAPLVGPAQLPAASVSPATLRNDAGQTYNAQLPTSWVVAGLSVQVEVDPDRVAGLYAVQSATPAVGAGTRLSLVVVPLQLGSAMPTMPSAASLLDEIVRRLPLRPEDVTLTVRAPYTLTSVTALSSSADWSTALSELAQLRSREFANRNVYGVVRLPGAGIVGMGYVGYGAALGWDNGGQWAATMLHELGHNFGRSHAPCGGVASPDAAFPYSGGALGATPPVDPLPAALTVVSPVGATDIMGYCGGTWFSDYNYREIQRFIESASTGAAAVAAITGRSSAAAAGEADLIQVAGVLDASGVRFEPVASVRAPLPTHAGGALRLRLSTRDGRSIEHDVAALEVDHGDGLTHFLALLPDPGPLVRVDLLGQGRLLGSLGPRTTALAAAQTGATVAPALRWSEAGGALSVEWDAAASPWLSVTWRADDGGVRVLALRLAGGRSTLDVAALPAGGRWVFALSDGLNAQRIDLAR